MSSLDRRSFLRVAGAGSAVALSGCGGSKAPPGSLSPTTAATPRVSLAHLPTPVEELPRLSRQLGGPRILVKRDDQTGLATGGNKARKLEFLLADALSQGADTLVTQGSAQSNHCRQTAAAAARHGLGCVLLLRGPEPHGTAEANLLLDRILGASLRFGAPSLEETGRELRARGSRPYLIPTGGSNEIGVMGYVAAMEELAFQLKSSGQHVDAIVLPTGSGGTQAGVLLGARTARLPVRVLGISVSRSATAARESVAELANGAAARLRIRGGLTADDVEVDDAFLGDGYGVMSEVEARAIRTVGASEGLLLDPVYTGRAFGALMALVSQRAFTPNETVLFWHTGGTPALFVSDYAAAL